MSNSIEKIIELNAPIERVWRALTDHHEFGTWFRVKLNNPFVPGQVTTGSLTYPGYDHLKWEVTVKAMERPHLFAFSWHPYAVDPGKDYSGEPPTLVEFHLEPIAGGTRLTVTESGFDALPSHRRAEALRMNDGGWAVQIKNIQTHVAQ